MYDYSVSESIPAKQPEKCFWLGSEKTFLDAQELHLEALGKQMSVKFLSGGGLNNFLQLARCVGLEKCFKIFHFN